MTTAVFDDLRSRLDEEPDPGRRVAALLSGLAEQMAATSNDQNVQKLARELRAAAPQLATALLAGSAAPGPVMSGKAPA